jgi:short subunit dehydrogenase-like uncharacterized protein
MKKLMIYGATGYTGRMAAAHAAAAGTPLIVAGRNPAALAELAAPLGVDYRVFALDDNASIDRALHDVGVLLNCAGPFAATAAVLMRAGACWQANSAPVSRRRPRCSATALPQPLPTLPLPISRNKPWKSW